MNNTSLKAIFDALPNPCLVLLPDSPRFTMVNANKAFCQATNTLPQNLINKGVFEVFPDNPNDLEANGRAPVVRILGLIDLIKNYKDKVNESELLNNIYDSTQELDLLIKDSVDKTQKMDL